MKKPKKHWSTALEQIGACREAIAWAMLQPSREVGG